MNNETMTAQMVIILLRHVFFILKLFFRPKYILCFINSKNATHIKKSNKCSGMTLVWLCKMNVFVTVAGNPLNGSVVS